MERLVSSGTSSLVSNAFPVSYEPPRNKRRGTGLIFYGFYVVAIIILILHFTGWLKRHNVEWLVLVLAVAVFPIVIFFR